jgi:hypothetical protein
MKRTSLADGTKQWWSAPVRFTSARRMGLRKPALLVYGANGTWLHQTPIGIRAPLSSELGARRPS